MRLLVVLTVVMICIVGLGYFVERGVSQVVLRMLSDLERGEVLADSGDTAGAVEMFRHAHEQWKAAQDTWNPFVYNTDLEEVEVVLARLISCTEERAFSQMKAELAHLRTRLRQIQAQERLILKNIL